MSELISKGGVYFVDAKEWTLRRADSGIVEFVVRFGVKAVRGGKTENGEFDWVTPQSETEITGYFYPLKKSTVAGNKFEANKSTIEQLKAAFKWAGLRLAELNDRDYSTMGIDGKPLGFLIDVRMEEFQGKKRAKVGWIYPETYTGEIGPALVKADAATVVGIAKEFDALLA